MSNIATLNRKGRPKGATNLATRERKAREAEAVRMLATQIGAEAVAAMSPLDIVRNIMVAAWRAGDVAGALAAATAALPYTSPRMGSGAEGVTIPPELMADDPIPEGDEPGPLNPVL